MIEDMVAQLPYGYTNTAYRLPPLRNCPNRLPNHLHSFPLISAFYAMIARQKLLS